MRITLPLPPNIGNRRGHWRRWKRKQDNYNVLCTAAHPARPVEPIAPAVLHATLYVWNRNDEDNAVARLKWAIDWLVDRQIILDDHPSALRLGTVTQEIDRKNQRLELWLMPKRTRVTCEACRARLRKPLSYSEALVYERSP
jgi:hypothetical protein